MNRKNKGFTLVELLAVIVILGIVLTIATTSVLRSKKDTIQKTKYMAAKEIVEIAEAYMIANNINSVDFRKLCEDGYLESNVTDPLTGKNVDSCEVLKGKIRKKAVSDKVSSNYMPNDEGSYAFDNIVYDLSPEVINDSDVEVSKIIVLADSIKILKDTSRKIKLILEPDNATNKNVYWESTDSNIVTVDDTGIITAKKAGEAIIKIKRNEDSESEIKIEVSNTNDIYANEITIDPGDIDLSIGETREIKVIVSPEKSDESDFFFRSTDYDVADLIPIDNNGSIIVKAKKGGTAYIIARAGKSGVANFIKVTVK